MNNVKELNKHQQYLKELEKRLNSYQHVYENIGEMYALTKEIEFFKEFFKEELK